MVISAAGLCVYFAFSVNNGLYVYYIAISCWIAHAVDDFI